MGQLPALAALPGEGPESQELRSGYASTSLSEAVVVLASRGPQMCFLEPSCIAKIMKWSLGGEGRAGPGGQLPQP